MLITGILFWRDSQIPQHEFFCTEVLATSGIFSLCDSSVIKIWWEFLQRWSDNISSFVRYIWCHINANNKIFNYCPRVALSRVLSPTVSWLLAIQMEAEPLAEGNHLRDFALDLFGSESITLSQLAFLCLSLKDVVRSSTAV